MEYSVDPDVVDGFIAFIFILAGFVWLVWMPIVIKDKQEKKMSFSLLDEPDSMPELFPAVNQYGCEYCGIIVNKNICDGCGAPRRQL